MLITIKCKNCGRKFEDYKSNHRKFCCKKCLNEYQKGKPGNRKKNGIYKKCLVCGNKFYIPKWRLKNNPKYCSKECSAKDRKGKIISSKIIKCKICGKKFKRFPYQEKIKRGIYCSRKCAKIGIGITLTGKKQSEYTKNKRADSNRGKKRSMEFRLSRSGNKCHLWKGGISFEPYSIKFNAILKEKIRKRDNYKCKECNQIEEKLKQKLSIHHIDYNKQNNKEDNLIALCLKCHSKTNFNRKDWMKHFKKMQKSVNN